MIKTLVGHCVLVAWEQALPELELVSQDTLHHNTQLYRNVRSMSPPGAMRALVVA